MSAEDHRTPSLLTPLEIQPSEVLKQLRHATHSTRGKFNPAASTGPLAASNWQVVLYKNRAVVAWDESRGQIQLKQLSPRDSQVIASHSFARCPMCGQTVNLDHFSFEAASYFRILESAISAYQRKVKAQGNRPRSKSVLTPMLDANGVMFRSESEQRPHQAGGGNPYLAQQGEIYELKNIPPGLLVQDYYEKFFVEECKLGSGSFGQVYLCCHKLDDLYLGLYAVKKVPVGDSKTWLTKMLKEVKIREHLHHHNIVSYKHSWLEMARANVLCPLVPWLFILMEYCDGGDLEKFIKLVKVSGNNLTETEIWCLFLDIVDGLRHLHHAGILHRDLKPPNILLRREPEIVDASLKHEERYLLQAVLSDFGTAELVTADATTRSGEGFTGTVEWTAPELLQQDEEGNFTGVYDLKSDMWSLGLILHFMAYGDLPYAPVDDPEDPRSVRDALLAFASELKGPASAAGAATCLWPLEKRAPQRSLDMRQCIAALLSPHAEKRPSCDELLSTTFLRSVKNIFQCDEEVRIALASRIDG